VRGRAPGGAGASCTAGGGGDAHRARGAGSTAQVRIRKYFAARNAILYARRHGSAVQRAKLAVFLAATLPFELVHHWTHGTADEVLLKLRGIRDALARRAGHPSRSWAQVSSARRADAPLAAGLVVAAYAAALRPYGIFDYVDEGLLSCRRCARRGGRCRTRLHTGYGPLYFRLQAWLLAAGGWMCDPLGAGRRAGCVGRAALRARRAGWPARRSPGRRWRSRSPSSCPFAPGRGAPVQSAPYPALYAASPAWRRGAAGGRGVRRGTWRGGGRGVIAGSSPR